MKIFKRKSTLKKENKPKTNPLVWDQQSSVRRINGYFFQTNGKNFRNADQELVFTSAVFDRIAREPTVVERQTINKMFKTEIADFNCVTYPYEKWVNDHEGRLATVILGTFFQDLKDHEGDSHEVPQSSVPVLGVSYLMYLNREIYMKYNLIERLVLIMPFLNMKSNQEYQEHFIEMVDFNIK